MRNRIKAVATSFRAKRHGRKAGKLLKQLRASTTRCVEHMDTLHDTNYKLINGHESRVRALYDEIAQIQNDQQHAQFLIDALADFEIA